MGQRISYKINPLGKSLKDLLIDNYTTFRAWYFDKEKSSLQEFDEAFGNQKVKDFLKENSFLQNNFEIYNEVLFNQLTSEFINPFCDWTYNKNQFFIYCGPSMYSWRYIESSEMVLKTNDKDFVKLWNYLTKGRSLINSNDYIDFTNDFKVGYLSYFEQIELKEKIELHFGKIETYTKKYWTFFERLKHKKALKNSGNGSYSISGHNPKSSGIEFVLQVLGEIEKHKTELISVIE